MYWKLDEDDQKVELDYPRDIQRVWKGVGYEIDTAFQWKDGNIFSYFLTPYYSSNFQAFYYFNIPFLTTRECYRNCI